MGALSLKYYMCFDGNSVGKNFTYEVQMTIISGDFGGIAFRVDSTGKNYYYFAIGQDGSYINGLVENNQLQPRLMSGNSSAISTGLNQTNVIAVVANESNLDLYVNRQHITSIINSTFTSDQIGVMAYDSSGNGTEVAFKNAKVWTM